MHTDQDTVQWRALVRKKMEHFTFLKGENLMIDYQLFNKHSILCSATLESSAVFAYNIPFDKNSLMKMFHYYVLN
jgi:hypothetical protein